MAARNTQYTLTYDSGVQGWPSFYSYLPDWMVGMNNYFYTIKGGDLYRHNVNNTRNNFYGIQYNSTIQSVFNDMPLENKLFKTINLEGDSVWGATLATDIQDSGVINANWFEKKEQVYYAFVRNSGTVPAGQDEYALRSLNGIGRSDSVVGGNTVFFDLQYKINNILSVGDMLYSVTIPIQDAFFLFIKNAIAESHGVLGHYCVFDITNTSTSGINLFAVESEVMKSYP